uniref:Integrase, catalytic region, zinc finger, CCHC-type, peptidase aspartic, catalytic n=1 Tax=Tanacetum cinerariifolium TaxID=118510 RepID=A0A6L2P7J2_TANCI|nr:hypothetical protein [Tanacetum cinerariifolium]
METIHVKFDELISMASKCNISGPVFNCLNFQDSSKDTNSIPSKKDLDNLFGPLYKEYYTTRTPEVLENSTTNTLDNEDTHSSSSIIVEENEASQIVTSSEEPVANEPTILVLNANVDESIQEHVTAFDESSFYNPFHTHVFKEAESSLTFQDPLNMHKFHQKHRSTDSPEDTNSIPSKENLDNLFGHLYKEYYATRTPEVSKNSDANNLDNEDTPSSSSIIIEENEASQIVTSSEELVGNEPTTPVSITNTDESIHEDVAAFDGNNFYNPFHTLVFKEAESSLTFQDQ